MGDYLVTFNLPLLIASFGVPTAITGFMVWLLQRSISKRDKKKEDSTVAALEADREAREHRQKEVDERDQAQRELLYDIVRELRAVTELSFATARAVQRIPDAKCNGDMTRAIAYAEQVQGELRAQLDKQALSHIVDN